MPQNHDMKKQYLFFLLLSPALLFSQEETASPSAIPGWVMEDWNFQTAGTATWIADNATYKNENEPYDAYGMQWEWGLGKKSLKGRLYCIREGKDIGTVWQFLQFWDPGEKVVRMIQIGADGTVGQGTQHLQEDGSTKSSEQFNTPTGHRFESVHHSWKEEGIFHTQSYDIVDGEWTKRRYYSWKLSK